MSDGLVPRALLALTLLATALTAAEAPDLIESSLTLELAQADVRDVFHSFATVLDAEVELDPEVDGKVTIQLREVSVATVLDALCDMTACDWAFQAAGNGRRSTLRIHAAARRESDPATPATLDSKVSISLVEAPPEQVFSAFATMLGAELEMAGGETVSIELDDTPLRQALDRTCDQLGCTWELDTTRGTPLLRVARGPQGGD